MVRSAIQLYTLRNVDRPFTEVLELVADAGFDGVEFAYRVTDEDPEEVRATLEETGLAVAGAHVGIDGLEDDFAETVAFYEELGVENVVIPWLDPENFESDAAVADAAERVEAVGERLADRDLSLHYHNHDHEYTDLDGETGWDAFIDATSCGIELDLGLALAAGDDVIERLRSLGERSALVHLKDYDVSAGHSVPVGEGDLDLDAVAEAVADNDSDWLIYEYEGEDPLATLETAAERTNDLC
ncbi:MAG: sugar phosphate isomerase/epimerase family protein [Haloarculaceae archaeon]